MTAPMTQLPPAPTRDQPDDFAPKGDAMMTALPIMVNEFNDRLPVIDAAVAAGVSATSDAAAAATSAASALAAPGTNATSTTSMSVTSGTVSLTIQTGKSFAIGAWLLLTRTSDVTKWMQGQVTSYTSGTGALVLSVALANTSGAGAGPYTDWTVTQSAPPSGVLAAVDLTTVGPSIKPTLLCDFINSRQLDPRFTYTMASPLAYYDSLGVLKYAAANQFVFDHDSATGARKGIPIWEARTNLLTYSEQLDQAAWFKIFSTVTANASGDPTGGSGMDKIVESAVTGAHGIYQARTASNETTAFSCFAKAAERTKLRMEMSNFGSASGGAIFDLLAGTVVSTDAANADYTAISATIEPIGSTGIFRCKLVVTKGSVNTTNNPFTGLVNGAGSTNYAGDGTSGAYVWGEMLEAASFVGPYVPTGASQVTRAAPAAPSIPVSQFSFNPSEGTLYAEATLSTSAASLSNALVNLNDGTSGNQITIYRNDSSNSNMVGFVATSSVALAAMQPSSLASGNVKAAMGFKLNDAAFSVSGGAPGTDASLTVPSVTTLCIGNTAGGTQPVNGWISKVAYYPRRLSNNELVALTTL